MKRPDRGLTVNNPANPKTEPFERPIPLLAIMGAAVALGIVLAIALGVTFRRYQDQLVRTYAFVWLGFFCTERQFGVADLALLPLL